MDVTQLYGLYFSEALAFNEFDKLPFVWRIDTEWCDYCFTTVVMLRVLRLGLELRSAIFTPLSIKTSLAHQVPS